eukprot:5248680-Pyramimonas_sp.AAC.1
MLTYVVHTHTQDNTFDENGFFVWRFQLPTSMWMYAGSAGVVIVTIACCLFPLAPHWVKVSIMRVLFPECITRVLTAMGSSDINNTNGAGMLCSWGCCTSACSCSEPSSPSA